MQQELERLLTLYDQRRISRRAVVQGLVALAVGSRGLGQSNPSATREPFVRAHTLNHVTLITGDVARSKAFYQRIAGLPIRDEGEGFCEFRLNSGFLGLYTAEAGERAGFDHFCLGMKNYDAKQMVHGLERDFPDSHPTLEFGDQVYVRDPDGVKVQFADETYKT
jgi:catechol 2,3-dioxygenase-like lactoylglutathione lyase family enzyme